MNLPKTRDEALALLEKSHPNTSLTNISLVLDAFEMFGTVPWIPVHFAGPDFSLLCGPPASERMGERITVERALVSCLDCRRRLPPVPELAPEPTVAAQHEETGRLWMGPRSKMPPRFFELNGPDPIHYEAKPGVRTCGDNTPNSRMTSLVAHVSCVSCLQRELRDAKYELQRKTTHLGAALDELKTRTAERDEARSAVTAQAGATPIQPAEPAYDSLSICFVCGAALGSRPYKVVPDVGPFHADTCTPELRGPAWGLDEASRLFTTFYDEVDSSGLPRKQNHLRKCRKSIRDIWLRVAEEAGRIEAEHASTKLKQARKRDAARAEGWKAVLEAGADELKTVFHQTLDSDPARLVMHAIDAAWLAVAAKAGELVASHESRVLQEARERIEELEQAVHELNSIDAPLELQQARAEIDRLNRQLQSDIRAGNKAVSMITQLEADLARVTKELGELQAARNERTAARGDLDRVTQELDETKREMERRGQAVSDAMGQHRGYDELIPAVRQLSERYTQSLDECERLRAGKFTPEEIHSICHNLHGTVSARAFADGCAAEQRKLYGVAPDADARAEGWKAAIEASAKVADAQAWSHAAKGFSQGPELNSAAIAGTIRNLQMPATEVIW